MGRCLAVHTVDAAERESSHAFSFPSRASGPVRAAAIEPGAASPLGPVTP
jgi:hypothetical protein